MVHLASSQGFYIPSASPKPFVHQIPHQFSGEVGVYTQGTNNKLTPFFTESGTSYVDLINSKVRLDMEFKAIPLT